jgi:hypothetical protein
MSPVNRFDENKEPRDRNCASRGSAHVEERYLPCVDGWCRLCGAPDGDIKMRDAITAKSLRLMRQSLRPARHVAADQTLVTT